MDVLVMSELDEPDLNQDEGDEEPFESEAEEELEHHLCNEEL